MQSTFKDGMLKGEGQRTYSSGKTVEGIWADNQLVRGKMSLTDGTMYEGEWVGGRPHGMGIKTISGGKRYEGMFSVGRPWGKGAKVSAQKREEGYWEKAKFIVGETPPEKLNEFNEQLQQIKSYY